MIIRAISPVIATIALIAIAAAAASIAGAEMLRKSQATVTESPVDVTEIFLVRLSNSSALMHAEYSAAPGWTSLTAVFEDDANNTITFSLPADSTLKKYDTELSTQVTVGSDYNVIITATGTGANSATVTVPVFVR